MMCRLVYFSREMLAVSRETITRRCFQTSDFGDYMYLLPLLSMSDLLRGGRKYHFFPPQLNLAGAKVQVISTYAVGEEL
jgi:hypothetical protein